MSELPEMQDVESSNIAKVGYSRGKCYVTFINGKTFVYTGVRRAVYDDLLEAKSVGKFYIANIRGNYDAEEISIPDADKDAIDDIIKEAPIQNEEEIEFIEQIAKSCHEANRNHCVRIGDTSQVAWEEAPEWQKQSARNGVEAHLNTLADGGEPKPEESHEGWLKEKTDDGWVYGEVKDADKKTHPCCVPYDELPDDQKEKDAIFIGVVKSFFELKSPVTPENPIKDDEAIEVDQGKDYGKVTAVHWGEGGLTVDYNGVVVSYEDVSHTLYLCLIKSQDQTAFAKNNIITKFKGVVVE